MKRILSIILAISFVMAVIPLPRTLAADTDEPTARAYRFYMPETLSEEIWDYSLTAGALQSSIVPLIGYGTHGYKYWTADDVTRKAGETVRVLQLTTTTNGRLRMYANYDSKPLTSNKDGLRVALALEKPCAIPGFYEVYIDAYDADAGYTGIWTRPLNEENRDITYYQASEAKNGDSYYTKTSDNKVADYYLKELVYNNGTDDHSISFYTGRDEENDRGLCFELYSVTYKPVTATGISLSIASGGVLAGETTAANVYVLNNTSTVGKLNDSYVKYKSSDESIAKIAPDGTITGVKSGKVNITATVGEFEVTLKNFVVGYKSYDFKKLIRPSADIWDSTVTGGAYQSSIIPFIGYGDHGYKYWTADDVTYAAAKTDRVLQMLDTSLRMYANYNGAALTSNKDGVRLALAFEKPKTQGFYQMDIVRASSGTTSKNAHVYARPLDEANKDITYYQAKEAALTTAEAFSSTTTRMPKLIYSGTEDHVFSFYSGRDEEADYGANLQFTSVLLVPAEVDGIALGFDKEELDKDSTAKASVMAMNGTKSVLAVADSYVEYKSSDEKVAKIAPDGTVTALDYGTATITATVGGYTASETLTVAEPVVIPGEEVTDTTVSVGIVALEGGSVATNLSSAVSEVEIGTKVIAEATASDGYEFAYWKDSNGKVISANAKETFVINVNTSIKAYFEKLAAESDATAPVYFYNGNGEALGSETVEKGKTFADVEKPKNVSLTGFEFDKWSIADNAIINSLTRAVALFKDTNNTYTVKVGDEAVATGKKYGESVTVKATEADFTCWKLGEKVMSYNASFTFNVYGDITLTKVCEGAADKVPTVVLDKIDGEYFLTYNVPAGYTKIEAGILFATSGTPDITSFYAKATEKTGSGQFTAKPNGSESIARGYVIFRDASGNIRVIYA